MAVQVEAPALVPPLRSSVMLDWPLVTNEVRMFSMEAAVRAQLVKALAKAPEIRVPVVLNMFAGNDERLVQFSQVRLKAVAAAKLSDGKDVRPEQPCQAPVKLVTALVFIKGKEVNPVQFLQAKFKIVAAPVLINGKEMRLEQLSQAD